MNLRAAVACILALLPSRLHRWGGCRLLGWQVDPTAYLGHSIIAAKRVTLGPYASVGHFNVIKGLEELTLADHAAIGFFNWISGPPLESGMFVNAPSRRPALIMGKFASILHRHIVDCTDTVTFGEFATLGGWRSTLMTHGLDLKKNQTPASPVTIGDRVVIFSNCIILGSVPARCVVAAGSVVRGVTKELVLYRGNPAVEVRELSADLGYFVRTGAPQ